MNHGFSAFFLEMLNGGAIAPELHWLVLLGIYLSKESHRRGLRWFDWFNLPPSMNLILAVFISDAGVCARSLIIWNWRRTGAGEFNELEVTGLVFGGSLIVIGFLCKIRALTYPDGGNRQWLEGLVLTGSALGAMLVFH